jgi:hypothetical protein
MPPRYAAARHPRKRGYAVFDREPRLQRSEDVEGVGLVVYDPPKTLPPHFGWYKRKGDAQDRADVLNRAGI